MINKHWEVDAAKFEWFAVAVIVIIIVIIIFILSSSGCCNVRVLVARVCRGRGVRVGLDTWECLF